MYGSYSQSYQDLFALETCKSKSYIEIGAYHPKISNNTFLLESLGWKGFSIEIDRAQWWKHWAYHNRKNIHFIDVFEYNFEPHARHWGYLSIDILGSTTTYKALQRIIEAGCTFDSITFEHDYYRFKDSTKQDVEDYLCDRGYKVAVYDVVPLRYIPEDVTTGVFETWFVKEDIDFEPISFAEWHEQRDLEFADPEFTPLR